MPSPERGAAPPVEGGAGAVLEGVRAAGRQDEDTHCPCADGPHPPLTPPGWRRPHGPDLLDVEDRRRLNEIAALKSGRRVIDLAVGGVTS